MFQFWGNFGAHFGARDLTLLKISGQHFWATFSGRKFPPKTSAQKLCPKNSTIFGKRIHFGGKGRRGRGKGNEGRGGWEGKGKRKGKREEDGEEEGDRI